MTLDGVTHVHHDSYTAENDDEMVDEGPPSDSDSEDDDVLPPYPQPTTTSQFVR